MAASVFLWRDQIVGHELELLARLGINWPVHQCGHIRCPFPDHEDRHPSWRWDSQRRAWFAAGTGARTTVEDSEHGPRIWLLTPAERPYGADPGNRASTHPGDESPSTPPSIPAIASRAFGTADARAPPKLPDTNPPTMPEPLRQRPLIPKLRE